MTDNAYEHIAALDSADKPWRRVWRCPATGVHVKTHARRRSSAVGEASWRISGSVCDENGRALIHAGKPAIVGRAYIFKVQSDADWLAEEAADRAAQDLDASTRLVVARVEAAALKQRALELLPG